MGQKIQLFWDTPVYIGHQRQACQVSFNFESTSQVSLVTLYCCFCTVTYIFIFIMLVIPSDMLGDLQYVYLFLWWKCDPNDPSCPCRQARAEGWNAGHFSHLLLAPHFFHLLLAPHLKSWFWDPKSVKWWILMNL